MVKGTVEYLGANQTVAKRISTASRLARDHHACAQLRIDPGALIDS